MDLLFRQDYSSHSGDILKRLTYASSKQQYLASLNEFSRLCRSKKRDELLKHISGDSTGTITLDDVFKCLKTALFHQAAEVRAIALRAIRYLLKDEFAVQSLMKCNLPIFIVRSIDISLENRTERIQALRLVRKFLSISPQLFPPAFTRSLIAIAQDGQSEHDVLTRACWALLAELSIMSPISSTRDTQNCAFNAIMDAALAGNQPHGMCESLISTLLYMLNWPKYRCLLRGDLDLQIFVAPFTDSHYTAPVAKDQKQRINQVAKFDIEPYDQRENKFTAAKITLISILRSWQGLIYLCEPQSSECNLVSNSCLKSLINMLYLPYNDVRRRLIDLIFELLYTPLPDSMSDFEVGLKFLEKHQLSMDSWRIHDAFVVDEAKAILPAIRSRSRMNLVNNYLALLLVALFHCNVVDALSEVIIAPTNQENSIRATILLYQLLSLAYQYLPTDSFSQYLTLSTLIRHATSKIDDSRDLANAALINLGRVHPLKKSSNYTNTRCSLFLGQILEFCSPRENQFKSSTLSSSVPQTSATLPYQSNSSTPTLVGRSSNHHHQQAICGISTNSTMTSMSSTATKNSSSSSASTLVNSISATATRPPTSCTISRSPSLSSRTNSLLAPSVSAATHHFKALFSLTSSTKSIVKSIVEQDWHLWDWEQINFMLTRPTDTMKKMSSQHFKAFIRRLVHFFKPSSNQYSQISINNERCEQLCETGCNLIDFLVESPEPKATELLNELLHDISISMHDPDGSGHNNCGSLTVTHGGLSNAHPSNPHINIGGTMIAQITPHPDINILSSSKLITTMSSTYFLFIGRLSNTMRGYQMLQKSTIMKLINNLTQASMLATSPAEVYVKLIIACFDYTKDFNGARKLLEKFLFQHPEDNVRTFATNFIRVLLRANVPDFDKWAIELLVRQLDSPLRVVHNAAADILDEACDSDDNLEGLIAIKQIKNSTDKPKNVLDILRSSGDSGLLLLSRYASSPLGLRYLLETPRKHLSCPLDSVLSPNASPTNEEKSNSNDSSLKDKDITNSSLNEYHEKTSGGNNSKGSSRQQSPLERRDSIMKVESEFDVELDRWRRVFNYRYVKLVEDVLNNSLTYHQKSDDGKYGRRVDKINLISKNSHLPPHLYGQLALHADGIEIIQSRNLLEPAYEMLRNPPKDLNYAEVSVLKFKSALWIIGNVAASESGYQILDNSRELVKLITNVAKNASVLSLRGTAFYVLGLLGSTEEGAEEMKEHGWIVQSNKVALPLDLGSILTKPQDTDLEAELLLLQSHQSSAQTSPERASDKSCLGKEGSKQLIETDLVANDISKNNNCTNNNSINDIANDSGTAGSSPSVRSSCSTNTLTNRENGADSAVERLKSHDDTHPILRENFSINQLDQIRKDILKHVTSLSHSVASRPAENSLLNLKRKFGLVFQYDLALYTEVCQQLAKYNFRLHARRFLQELFLGE